jgi:hypothetical protein
MSGYIQRFWAHTTHFACAEESDRARTETSQNVSEPYLPSSEEQAEEEAMLDERELT